MIHLKAKLLCFVYKGSIYSAADATGVIETKKKERKICTNHKGLK